MAVLPTYFQKFSSEIQLTEAQSDCLRRSHLTLRDRLEADENLSPLIVSTFLHGSYRRSTAIRPKSKSRSDVDIIVVTTLDRHGYTPQEALEVFRPFFKEHYADKYCFQGRSIGVELSEVDLDIVITSAPSEVDQNALRTESVKALDTLEEAPDWRLHPSWPSLETRMRFPLEERSRLYKAKTQPEWQTAPLRIPDREAEEWQQTHPIEQYRWTVAKSKTTNKYFLRVVKAIKWWRRAMQPIPDHPKGYPLEHIVGDCCPDSIGSMAQGVTETLERIVTTFAGTVALGTEPYSRDRGVDQNVLKRLDRAEFAVFYEHVKTAADLARRALDAEEINESAALWRELFGSRFPEPPDKGTKSGRGGEGVSLGGFSERSERTDVSGGLFG
jgi:predicted nucleotidyltransferase